MSGSLNLVTDVAPRDHEHFTFILSLPNKSLLFSYSCSTSQFIFIIFYSHQQFPNINPIFRPLFRSFRDALFSPTCATTVMLIPREHSHETHSDSRLTISAMDSSLALASVQRSGTLFQHHLPTKSLIRHQTFPLLQS